MRNVILFFLISLAVLCMFCSKSSTNTEQEEDNINVEVTVKENNVPVENLFVKIEAKIQDTIRQREDDIRREISFETTETEQQTTNKYGKAIFNYKNKSLPDRGGIAISKVTIKRLNDELISDTVEKLVKKGETLKLEYDL